MRGLVWAWLLAIASSGCRGPDALSELEGGEAAGATASPAAQGSAPDADASAGGGAPSAELPAQQAAAGGSEAASDCHAEPVTLEQVHAGRVRSGFAVSLGELAAASQKFLLSEAKSGSCLWGAFVA